MPPTLRRFVLSLAGAGFGLAASGVLEAPSLAQAPAVVSVLTPVALVIGLAVAFASVLTERTPRTPWDHLGTLRHAPAYRRATFAALLPMGVLFAFAAEVAIAHAARLTLSQTAPLVSAADMLLCSFAALFVACAATLAALPTARQAFAISSSWSKYAVDPRATTRAALVVVGVLHAVGIALGDESGTGPTPLAIFGVLKRKELDLAPVWHAGIIALAAHTAITLGHTRTRSSRFTWLGYALFAAAGALTTRAATQFNTDAAAVDAARRAPLGRLGLALLTRATDADHDGYSRFFGGGDCNDSDPRVHPGAHDIPDDGIDQDCSGSDATRKEDPARVVPVADEPDAGADAGALGARALDKKYNVILITIDTLRADVSFLGYPKPNMPQVGKLADKSLVYEHAYALASYTGRCIGPMLIGKYPSETLRDGSHFGKYAPENVFITERLKDAGVHTMGAAGHWYFKPWSGVTQGMDTWDLTALSPNMGDNDTTVSGEGVSTAAIKLLGDEKNTGSQFFMWLHYFDPHAQYVTHREAPNFAEGEKGGAAMVRAGYDSEVWYTDMQVGRVIDFVESQSWADHTAFIITADHGEAFGEHDMSWHGAEIWQPLVRIPLVVYAPGVAGKRVRENRGLIDLAPTIAALAGLPQDATKDLRGRSLVDDAFAAPEVRDVLIDMPVGQYNMHRRALVTGEAPGMKLIHFGGAMYKLFDLEADPGELKDVSKDSELFQPILKRLEAATSRLEEIEVKPDAP